MADTAAIDALIHGSKIPVSFRHLSAHLRIPTRAAQHLLQAYAAAHPPLTILWCVTSVSASGIKRVSLTTKPSSSALSKTVWAIAAAPPPESLWLAEDATRDRRLAAAPSSDCNELRDGRFNPIQSSTSKWRAAEVGVETAPDVHKFSTSSSLLAAVKEKAKARDARRAKNGKQTSLFKSKSSVGENSLFSNKRLGASAAARIQADDAKRKSATKPRSRTPRSAVKKARRVVRVESEDDEESDQEKMERENVDEVDEEDSDRVAMELEASELEAADAERAEADRAEVERAEAELAKEKFVEASQGEKQRAEEERAELQREVEELTRKLSDDEPESPVLKEVVDDGEGHGDMRIGKLSPVRTSEGGKRSLNEAFGMPNGSNRSAERRIRKFVDVTVELSNGYMETTRVQKTFDENGNEISDGASGFNATEIPSEQKNGENTAGAPESAHPAGSKIFKAAKLGPNTGRDKEAKLPPSKRAAAASTRKAPKKKVKGNIRSYFGKRA